MSELSHERTLLFEKQQRCDGFSFGDNNNVKEDKASMQLEGKYLPKDSIERNLLGLIFHGLLIGVSASLDQNIVTCIFGLPRIWRGRRVGEFLQSHLVLVLLCGGLSFFIILFVQKILMKFGTQSRYFFGYLQTFGG